MSNRCICQAYICLCSEVYYQLTYTVTPLGHGLYITFVSPCVGGSIAPPRTLYHIWHCLWALYVEFNASG